MSKTQFTAEGSQLTVTRTFNAPIEHVWRAWTEVELLDQWWAPSPWKSQTKEMKFEPGGTRLYAMIGPEGEEHWGLTTYVSINQPTNFTGEDAFTDNQGTINENFPIAKFSNHFEANGLTTQVTVITQYASEEQIKMVFEMGFKEGLSSAYENLDAVLKHLS